MSFDLVIPFRFEHLIRNFPPLTKIYSNSNEIFHRGEKIESTWRFCFSSSLTLFSVIRTVKNLTKLNHFYAHVVQPGVIEFFSVIRFENFSTSKFEFSIKMKRFSTKCFRRIGPPTISSDVMFVLAIIRFDNASFFSHHRIKTRRVFQPVYLSIRVHPVQGQSIIFFWQWSMTIICMETTVFHRIR